MRKRLTVLSAIALLACSLDGCDQPTRAVPAPAPQEQPPAAGSPAVQPAEVPLAAATTTALVGATVIPCDGTDPVVDAVVILDRDRIASVGPRSETTVPEDAMVIDVSDRWLIPGLVDSHVHFFQSAGLYTRPDIVDLRSVRPYENEVAAIDATVDDTFKRWLVSGVTSVVDMGGPYWNFEVRDRARASVLAPRVAVAGPLIATVERPQMDIGDPPIIKASSPKEARELVKKQLEKKPDLIKLWFIVSEDHPVTESGPIMQAAIEEAHAGGVRVAVHATELETAMASVEYGADVLVHSIHDEPVNQPLIDLMKQKGTIYTPTLAVYEGYAEVLGREVDTTELEERYGDPAVMGTWQEFAVVGSDSSADKSAERKKRFEMRTPIMQKNLITMSEAQIPIAAGTDAGNIGTLHGPTFHRELWLMAEAGMTPAEILISATRDAARVFAPEPGFGTVVPGNLADLLVLDADPLEDVGNLSKIHMVVKGGVVLTPQDIIGANPEWVVQKQVDAYNARDIDLFLSFYAEDAVLERVPTGEIISKTREGMRETYGEFFEENPDLLCRILQRTVTGDMVVDRELVTGIGKRPYLRAVAIYRVTDGLIDHVWFLPKEK